MKPIKKDEQVRVAVYMPRGRLTGTASGCGQRMWITVVPDPGFKDITDQDILMIPRQCCVRLVGKSTKRLKVAEGE